MLRNTRSKLMRILNISLEVLTIKIFIFRYVSQSANKLKSMFSAKIMLK